jgi:Asp-tRNA(Asn)/Glu-tRNA(Gln) amidotransferase C subunit
MFTKKVTDDDNFMALSASAQALYLHLSMSADDDGFCNQVSISMFKAHASVQDLQALLEKRYIYQFENGVIVIKHWRMANALRKDRYTPTAFQEELAQLQLKDNGSYTWLPNGCQSVAACLPQDSIGKDRLGNDSIKSRRFTPPTATEVKQYANEKGYQIDADGFVDFYESKGWKVGNQSMKDWKAAVRNWVRRDKDRKTPAMKLKNAPSEQHPYDKDEIRRRAKE